MLKRLILTLLLCSVLLAPAVAEDDTHTEALAEAAAPGLGTLVLVVGMVTVIVVGGGLWARDNFTGFEDEDE